MLSKASTAMDGLSGSGRGGLKGSPAFSNAALTSLTFSGLNGIVLTTFSKEYLGSIFNA
jgi:hypothetical protein